MLEQPIFKLYMFSTVCTTDKVRNSGTRSRADLLVARLRINGGLSFMSSAGSRACIFSTIAETC